MHPRIVRLPFALIILCALNAGAQDDGYPEGTLAPNIDLGLQPVAIAVPGKYRSQVPENITLNLPPGFSASVFAAGLRGPRLMAVSPEGVLHVCNMRARQILALPDRTAAIERDLPTWRAMTAGNRIYENLGGGAYRDATRSTGSLAAGWAWGGGFIDVDNDGWQDLHVPNGLWSGKVFADT